MWKPGDRVELTLPMRLTAEPLADDRSQQALLYGPLVLAGQFPKNGLDAGLEHNQGPEVHHAPPIEVPALQASGADPSSWVQPVPGEALTFRAIAQDREIELKPLNQSWQRFAVYWTVS